MKNVLITILLSVLLSPQLATSQNVISPGQPQPGYTLESKLIDSSVMHQYKFSEPFSFQYYNSSYHRFYYDDKNLKLHFVLNNIGNGKLNIIFPTERIRQIIIRDEFGNFVGQMNEEYLQINKNDLISFIYDNISKVASGVVYKGYSFDFGDINRNNHEFSFQIEFYKPLKEESLFSIAYSENNQTFEEITRYMFAPLLTLFHILGETDFQGSFFANYKLNNYNENISLFTFTNNKYSEKGNLEQYARKEKRNYRIADWNDIKKNYSKFLEFIKNTKQSIKSFMVTYNGMHFWGTKRHYFVAIHNHRKPSSFLSHANINNHYIDLGSWYNLNQYILLIKER